MNRPDPLPEGDRAAHREPPEPYWQNVRHAEAGHAHRYQRHEHPFRPLYQADVAAQPQPFGPRLRVRDHGAGHQAEQRHPAERRIVPAVEEPPDEPAEYRAVRDPVHGRVDERAPFTAGALDPGEHSVEHVEQHEDRAGERARKQFAHREQSERTAGDADSADDGDGVGGDRRFRERLAHRGEHT